MPSSTPGLDELRLFIKVAETNNISQAAAAVGLTQPSVSRAMRALEQKLQTVLFHRTGRGVSLTSTGEQALVRARALVLNADQFATEIREQAHAPSGVVTVALLTAYIEKIGAQLYDEVRQRFPGIVLSLRESFSVQHEDWLSTGRVDVALITRYRKPRTGGHEVLAVSDLMVVGNSGQWDDGGALPFRELARVPLVLPAAPHGMRVHLEEVARRQGIRLNVVLEADSMEAQKAVISRGHCHAMWSQHLVQQWRVELNFAARRVVGPRLPRYVLLETSTHHPLSRAAREVTRILRRLVLEAHSVP